MKNIFVFILLFSSVLLSGCGTPTPDSSSNATSSDQVSDGLTDEQAALSGTSCGDGALLSYNCWTSRFPEDINGRGDVTCRFTIQCCGKDLGNGWETVYPEFAGLRGFVDHGSILSEASCKDLDPLDVDGDGTQNSSDETPFGSDQKPWDAKQKE